MLHKTKKLFFLLNLLWVVGAQAFSEDTRSGADDVLTYGHSTFHYELTYVMALAAGLNEQDAQRVALASNAVDTFPNELNLQPCEEAIENGVINDVDSLYILGTVRNHEVDPVLTEEARLFHWARRPATNRYGQNYPAEGIDADTCAYFGETCSSEISGFEAWAVEGDTSIFDTSIVPQPCVAEANGLYKNIPAGSLVALGVYIHALADSYSHQRCMADSNDRTHNEATDFSCESREWHLEQEYGEGSRNEVGEGVIYSYNAALATYQAVQTYIVYNQNQDIYGISDAESINLNEFINDFIQTDDADDRSCLANKYIKELKSGNPIYIHSDERPCSR